MPKDRIQRYNEIYLTNPTQSPHFHHKVEPQEITLYYTFQFC